MPQYQVLIVEDDANIAQLVQYNLEKAGYTCAVRITGEDAFDFLDRQSVDLIILDIMLPKIDGLEICRRIKADRQLSGIPVIMLTAKGEEVDRVVGFELGADDYVVKPFSPRELVLRIKAILNRGKAKAPVKEILAIDDLKVDIPRCRVTVGRDEVKLTAMEFKLLVTLMQTRGRVQSRDQLLDDVWNLASDVTTRTIDTHVKRLRQKLGSKGELIETVRGYGYRFNDDSTE